MFSENDYKKLYTTGSRAGLFYGTGKVHKLQGSQGVNELTVRPIIFNIGTADYETAKYMDNLLSPLGKSQHAVLNSKEFVEEIKAERIRIGYKMISFDVKSLFTNVAVNETIETILQKVYVEKKIKTQYQNRFSKNYFYFAQNTFILDLMLKYISRLVEWQWDPRWAHY